MGFESASIEAGNAQEKGPEKDKWDRLYEKMEADTEDADWENDMVFCVDSSGNEVGTGEAMLSPNMFKAGKGENIRRNYRLVKMLDGEGRELSVPQTTSRAAEFKNGRWEVMVGE